MMAMGVIMPTITAIITSIMTTIHSNSSQIVLLITNTDHHLLYFYLVPLLLFSLSLSSPSQPPVLRLSSHLSSSSHFSFPLSAILTFPSPFYASLLLSLPLLSAPSFRSHLFSRFLLFSPLSLFTHPVLSFPLSPHSLFPFPTSPRPPLSPIYWKPNYEQHFHTRRVVLRQPIRGPFSFFPQSHCFEIFKGGTSSFPGRGQATGISYPLDLLSSAALLYLCCFFFVSQPFFSGLCSTS